REFGAGVEGVLLKADHRLTRR
ncbi:MAG: hypothetical protein QOJ54_2263, partial [Aliidongia sp.]|nr:hypothetical protein [Aliidongia sp.]